MRDIPDYVQRRVIVEYGRKYVYATLTDSAGKILQEELWTQPFLLDVKDAADEANDTWQAMWQHVNDTVVFPTARGGGADGKPEE